jgi:predicted membrane-bound mannosyltransferase
VENIAQNDQFVETPPRDYVWLAGCAVVTIVAAFMRFWQLGLKPFHHDEGVNGFFLTTLVKDGVYKYDPGNYHGPTLYYIAQPFAEIFGLKTVPMRVSVAIFGFLTVIVALYLKNYMGRIGTLLAALFIAIAPGMVYISRYFIHEIFFVFLSLTIVVAVLFFIEKDRAGPFAVVCMVIILLTCFLPSALNLATYLGGENGTAVWAFRLGFFIIEGVLVFFVIRMLLGWEDGRPVYLLLASASAALLFATKETTFITLGTMLIAFFCVWLWRRIQASEAYQGNWFRCVVVAHIFALAVVVYYRRPLIDGAKWLYDNFLGPTHPPEPLVFYGLIFLGLAGAAAWILFLLDLRRANEDTFTEPVDLTWANFRERLGHRSDLILTIAATATIFIYLGVLFFSSFFTYSEGVGRAFEAYAIWTKTGNKDHTQNGYFGYVKWAMKVEAPLLLLSALGILVAMLRGKHRFAMFTALWAFGLFVAYTVIPYKTPWLALSFFLPMCLIAGYGIGELIASKNIALKATAIALAITGTSILAYQSYSLNFVRYDDEEMGYVYAHTKRGFLDLIREIDRYAEKSGRGTDATIEIVSPEYWPMTWYLNDYDHANFHGNLTDANTAEMIVAKKDDQDTAITQRYSAHYKLAGVWPLRPGVDLTLLVRKDLADREAQEVYKITEFPKPR